MFFSPFFVLSVSLLLLVTAGPVSSLNDPDVKQPTAHADAAKNAMMPATVYKLAQDPENRGGSIQSLTSEMLDTFKAIATALTQSPKLILTQLFNEENAVKRLILSHQFDKSVEHPGALAVHRKSPLDPRFTGSPYERACEFPMIKTPSFEALYNDLVANIGPFAALLRTVRGSNNLDFLPNAHNRMLQRAQFASWFKAGIDPEQLLVAAKIDAGASAKKLEIVEGVVSSYDSFINLQLTYGRLNDHASDKRKWEPLFTQFTEEEFTSVREELLKSLKKTKWYQDVYVKAGTSLTKVPKFVAWSDTNFEEVFYAAWFIHRIEPGVAYDQFVVQMGLEPDFLEKYAAFIIKKLKGISKPTKEKA